MSTKQIARSKTTKKMETIEPPQVKEEPKVEEPKVEMEEVKEVKAKPYKIPSKVRMDLIIKHVQGEPIPEPFYVMQNKKGVYNVRCKRDNRIKEEVEKYLSKFNEEEEEK